MDPNSIPWYVWFVSGALTSLGILILLDDRLTNRITSRDNLGWLLLAAGLVLLIGWFLIPFFPVIWTANADSVGIDSYAIEVSRTSAFTTMTFTDTVDQLRTSVERVAKLRFAV